MYRLGKVLHLSNSKNLILRTDVVPKIGTPTFNNQLETVGAVFDVFGPISNPYVAVKPRVKNPEDYVGQPLYIEAAEEEGAKNE